MSLEDITEEQAKELDAELAENPAVSIVGFQVGVSEDRTCTLFRFTMPCPTCAAAGKQLHLLQTEFLAMDIETGIDFVQAMQACLDTIKQ